MSKPDDELTYEQEYNVPIEIVLDSFNVKYAECGSHQILVTGRTELSNLQTLYEQLKKIKGIKL